MNKDETTYQLDTAANCAPEVRFLQRYEEECETARECDLC